MSFDFFRFNLELLEKVKFFDNIPDVKTKITKIRMFSAQLFVNAIQRNCAKCHPAELSVQFVDLGRCNYFISKIALTFSVIAINLSRIRFYCEE